MFNFLSIISRLLGFWITFKTELVDINHRMAQARLLSTPPIALSRFEHLVDECKSPKLTSTCRGSSPLLAIPPGSEAGYESSQKTQVLGDSPSLAPPSPSRSVSSVTKSDAESILSASNFPANSSSSATAQCACQKHARRDPIPSHSSLLDELCEELIEWPNGGTKRYLPDDQFKRLVTLESIETELGKGQVKDSFGAPSREMVRMIFERYSRLFTVLVLSDLTKFIYDFVEEGLHDGHFPLRRNGQWGFVSRLHDDYHIKSTQSWTLNAIRKFDSDQWSLAVPVFRRTPSMENIQHYELADNQMMPLILDASEDPAQIKRGGFGEVYEVMFHPAHQFLNYLSRVGKNLNPSFAVKRQIFRNKDAFDREVEMHKLLSGGRYHCHLAQLVATYEHRGRFHLIFPFAKCNLRTYWEQTPCPDFSQLTVGWFLRQVKGLASAVQRIHGYRDTRHALDPLGNTEDSMAPSLVGSEGERPYYARHGDIKAENILWSDEDSRDEDARFTATGLMILADFGEMRHYQTSTQFRKIPTQIAESPAYAPPEVASSAACAQTSRAYDIWSLGCVFLEFTVWLLCDWEELCRFTQERGQTFHTILKSDSSEQAGPKALLNESVRNCISNLHRKSRCSKFVHELLDLVSKMLEVDPALRITSGQLNAALSQMGEMASNNPDYLIEPRPSHALCCCQRINSCPKQGTPLPPRPSILKDMECSEQTRGKVPPKYYWNLATDLAMPGRKRKSNAAVERWARAVLS